MLDNHSVTNTNLYHRQLALKLLRVILPAHDPAVILKEFVRKREVLDWTDRLHQLQQPAAPTPAPAAARPPAAGAAKGKQPPAAVPSGKNGKGGKGKKQPPPAPQAKQQSRFGGGKGPAFKQPTRAPAPPPAAKGAKGKQAPTPAPAAPAAPTPAPAAPAPAPVPVETKPKLVYREENLLEQIIALLSDSIMQAAPDPRAYSLADEAVCLLRVLLQTAAWTPHIHAFVRAAVLKLPDVSSRSHHTHLNT